MDRGGVTQSRGPVPYGDPTFGSGGVPGRREEDWMNRWTRLRVSGVRQTVRLTSRTSPVPRPTGRTVSSLDLVLPTPGRLGVDDGEGSSSDRESSDGLGRTEYVWAWTTWTSGRDGPDSGWGRPSPGDGSGVWENARSVTMGHRSSFPVVSESE